MFILTWIAALISLIPIIAAFTAIAWFIGIARGAAPRRRFTASKLVSGAVRRWGLWYAAGLFGMVAGGLSVAGTSFGQIAAGLIALPLFALSQYEAFWIGYLIGDKQLARREAKNALAAPPAQFVPARTADEDDTELLPLMYAE